VPLILLALFCFYVCPHEGRKPIVCRTHLGLPSSPLDLLLSFVLWQKVSEHGFVAGGRSGRQSVGRIPLRHSNTAIIVTTASTPHPSLPRQCVYFSCPGQRPFRSSYNKFIFNSAKRQTCQPAERICDLISNQGSPVKVVATSSYTCPRLQHSHLVRALSIQRLRIAPY
jgi:hypothetical protein